MMPVNPPSIPGLGTTGGFEFWVQSEGDATLQRVEEVTREFIAKTRERPELRGVNSTINTRSRQLLVDVDRDKSESLGVPVQDVYSTLQTLFGSLYVSQFPKNSRLFQVILQAEPDYRTKPEDLQNMFVRNRNGQMVPLKAVATTRYVTGADIVTRFNNFTAAKITGDAAAGLQLRPGARRDGGHREEVLPQGFSYAWSGQAYEERKAGSTAGLVFAFALVMVFLILAAQYEKWTLADRRAAGGAFRAVRCDRGDLDARHPERRVFPDRPDGADRAGREERDPDLRVRGRVAAQGRPVALRRGGGCGQAAAAADHHDLAGLHPGLHSARDRERRLGREPAVAGHGRDRRHARRDGDRDLLHPDVLLGLRDARRPHGGEENGASSAGESGPDGEGAAHGPH